MRDIFLNRILKEIKNSSSKRTLPEIPKDCYVLRGLVHDYICKEVDKKPMRQKWYLHLSVIDVVPFEEKHIGERHNVIVNSLGERIINILNH